MDGYPDMVSKFCNSRPALVMDKGRKFAADGSNAEGPSRKMNKVTGNNMQLNCQVCGDTLCRRMITGEVINNGGLEKYFGDDGCCSRQGSKAGGRDFFHPPCGGFDFFRQQAKCRFLQKNVMSLQSHVR